MELDHVIAFVTDPDATAATWFPGFTVEPGQRHAGQGTINRRVVFPRTFVELLGVDDPDVHRSTGLGFGPRCAGEPGACPFGVVLRGKGEEAARTSLEHVRDEVLRKINLYDRPISIAIAAVSTDRPNPESQNLLDRTGWLLHSIKQDDHTLHPFRVVGETEVRS